MENKKASSADLPKTFTPKEVERIVEEQSFMEILTYDESFEEEECDLLIQYIPDDEKVFVFHGDDPDEMWLFEKLLALFANSNDHVFNFDIDHVSGCMVVAYEEGDDMKLMSGIGPGALGNRKLTAFCNLNEGYEGGDFHVTTAPSDVKYAKAATAIFPTFMPCEIEKVTKGTKYVLWAWVGGTKRFK